jgi:acyl-coenzyme A thioesterase PaaI-like protein
MPQESTDCPAKTSETVLSGSNCFACGPGNPRGLRLVFHREKEGAMAALWTPEPELEGYSGIVHGGIVSTVLDEAMAKVVAESGAQALTAELRVRFRQQTPSGTQLRIRGWIESRTRRMIQTEAQLCAADGSELAHAWAVFLPVAK